jgi:hypothetical protein
MFIEKKILRYDKEFFNEEKIKDQLALIKNKNVKANISLLYAKNNIEDELKFDRYIKEVFRYINENCLDNESALIKRDAHFTGFLHAFHFNYPYFKIKYFLEQVIEIDSLNKIENFEPYFYLFLLQILNSDHSGKINYFSLKPTKRYAQDKSSYLYNFLEGVSSLKEGRFKSAKHKLIFASNTHNQTINSWARQLLVVINFKQGNIDLVTKLIALENNYLLSDNSKTFFTLNSSIFFIAILSKQLFLSIPEGNKKGINNIKVISPIHDLLIKEIKTNRTI